MRYLRQKVEKFTATYKIFYSVFFFSGACSLVYELIWIKMFIPIFGIGLYSASAVISSFMAGLALGSYICGRIIDYKKNLLKYYAFFEFVIGIYAVILPVLINTNRATMPFFYNTISTNFYIFSIFRFIFAFILLIIPCSLIGATLPLMSRFLIVSSKGNVEKDFSFLYALNTFGAACGCLIIAFFMFEYFRLTVSSYMVAIINMLIGIFAYLYSLSHRFDDYSSSPRKFLNITGNEAFSKILPHRRNIILFAAFLSGFCALSFELLWFRTLMSVVPSDAYLFPVLLITILVGNSLGYFFISACLARIKNHSFVIGIAMILNGIIIALSLRYIPFLIDKEIYSNRYIWFVCPMMVLPASFVIGMIFPNLVALYSSGIKNVGHDIGNIYSINTVGAMLGSFFTAFVFIPFLGLRNTLFYSLLGYVLTGGLLFITSPKRTKQRLILIFCALLSSIFLINKLMYKDLFKDIFVQRVGYENEKLIFYKEGVISSIGLFKNKDFYFIGYSNKTRARVDIAYNGPIKRMFRLEAHIPTMLHSNTPCSVLNIGFGTGTSAYSLTLHTNIKKIDNVEIIAETMGIIPFLIDDPGTLFSSPKTNIFVDDGRNFLFVTKEKYDIIFIYPYSPLFTDAIYLYTKEFLQLCKNKLNKDGLVSIWFPVNSLGESNSRILLKTFLEVFPYSTLWNTLSTNFSYADVSRGSILVGTANREVYNLYLSPDYLKTRLSSLNEKAKSELLLSDIHDVRDLLRLCIADSDSLAELSKQEKEIVSDDRTILDYRTARKRWSQRMGNRRGSSKFLPKQ